MTKDIICVYRKTNKVGKLTVMCGNCLDVKWMNSKYKVMLVENRFETWEYIDIEVCMMTEINCSLCWIIICSDLESLTDDEIQNIAKTAFSSWKDRFDDWFCSNK